MENEKLKKIPGHSLYSVTKDGRVFSHRYRKGFITGSVSRGGYIRLHAINDDGKRSNLYVHRAVALAHLPNLEGKPFINHKDSNPANNHLDNLEWCTHKENMEHCVRVGHRIGLKGEENPTHKYSKGLVRKLRKLYKSGKYTQTSLSRIYNMPIPTVHVIVRNKQWRNI